VSIFSYAPCIAFAILSSDKAASIAVIAIAFSCPVEAIGVPVIAELFAVEKLLTNVALNITGEVAPLKSPPTPVNLVTKSESKPPFTLSAIVARVSAVNISDFTVNESFWLLLIASIAALLTLEIDAPPTALANAIAHEISPYALEKVLSVIV
jgi:hypothetical protein